eukprot:TRINITY_DN98875_c0_g1_i1.p1 TRINITY_DN98875_c0_g1~~TRINITY_DN98875_c0_g1_i1.p1  ORF type:complete len:118 (-),score=9.03 TRINITY_DN98875_c0_g1_i1:324-677(-)
MQATCCSKVLQFHPIHQFRDHGSPHHAYPSSLPQLLPDPALSVTNVLSGMVLKITFTHYQSDRLQHLFPKCNCLLYGLTQPAVVAYVGQTEDCLVVSLLQGSGQSACKSIVRSTLYS